MALSIEAIAYRFQVEKLHTYAFGIKSVAAALKTVSCTTQTGIATIHIDTGSSGTAFMDIFHTFVLI